MKLNLKTLAAAAALAAASVPSMAAISSGSNPTLLLVAYDSSFSGNQTYYRNLGTLSTLAAPGVTTFAAPSGSIFSQQMTGLDPSAIGWMIVALDNSNSAAPVLYTAAHQAGVTAPGIGAVNTVTAYSVGPFPSFGALDNAANGYFNSATNEYTGASAQGGTNNGAKSNAADTVSAWTNGANGDAGVGVGDHLNLFSTTYTALTQLYQNASLSAFGDGAVAGGYFTLLADGGVTWTNANGVSAVPVPGAALLFGPGLLGIWLSARRRKQQA